ncbi:uncharacterized protein J4E87_002280 [Alternaria ethzedia]|uniref:uncharacterized protein n=1 Tax=Alternaria ethzedia TaxID=181014 RepID=UPI0020C1EFE7|nr:uncharacterized protein J4E87_002280 [Alternaria ethzedia]KAI4631575.1 hypothetical protein J4E87_002280 [Alternaria ethzedia]
MDNMPTYYDTIIDPSGERLSSEAAEIISEMNRQRSPLLRLPAELRNKIYEYALGGMELRISYRNRELGLVAAMFYNTPVLFTSLHRLVGLTLVSRQLYAETKILPFELCTMLALRFTFNDLIERLNITQRQAISTIRAHYRDACNGTAWEDWPAVRSLKGLKCVVVFGCPTMEQLKPGSLIETIEKGLGRDDVDVLVEFER